MQHTTIISTIEADGAFWTVVLTHGCTPETSGGQVLVFIRDWIIGGTRQLTVAFTDALAIIFSTGHQEDIERRLLGELLSALNGSPACGHNDTTPFRRMPAASEA